MDLISLMDPMVWPLAATPPDAGVASWRDFSNSLPQFKIEDALLLVAGIVSTILSLWLASRIVVEREFATFGRAVSVWFLHFLLVLVMAGGMAFLITLVPKDESFRMLSVIGGILLLWIVLTFLIPMKLYQTGFWRVLGMLLLAFVMNIGLSFAIGFGYGFVHPEAAQQSLAFQSVLKQQIEALGSGRLPQAGAGPELEIELLLTKANPPFGPRPKLREREAAVRELQAKLNTRKKTLAPNDAEGVRKFQDQLARYLRLLDEVKFELAAESKGSPR